MEQNQTIEKTTLSQLIHNEEFNRKVIPFLKKEYFHQRSEQILFEEINEFVEKYSNPPTKTSLEIEIENRKDLSDNDHKSVLTLLNSLENSEVDYDWLLNTVENKMVDVRLTYNKGLDRYYGLVELAEKYNVFKKISTRYELPDGSKQYGKTILNDPKKYFTQDVMDILEECAKKEFRYGGQERITEQDISE